MGTWISDIWTNPEKYSKFWIALAAVGGQLVLVCAPTTDAQGQLEAAFVVTSTEWYSLLVAAAAAIGVERIANRK